MTGSDKTRNTWRRTGRIAAALGVISSVAMVPLASSQVVSASTKTTISIAFSPSYVIDTTGLATEFYTQVRTQFEKLHPGVTVQFVQLPGSYNDIISKLSLLYRNSSSAPDVAEMPSGQIGLFASTGYFAPLNSYLKSTTWWNKFPAVVQSEGTFGGKVYAVDQGENVSAMLYNVKMFKKAGIPVPWKPKTMADVLAAAKKIKAALPSVVPLWLEGSTGSGAGGALQGVNNLIVGTTAPTIYDAATKKWVVDSPGIRQALKFYSQVYSARLGASVTDLFSPSALTAPLTLFQQGKLAMAVGSNFYTGNWTKFISAPYWPQAAQTMAVTPIPTYAGQGSGIASTLGGWDFAMSSVSRNKALTFQLINLMENEQFSIESANWAGFVSPNKSYWNLPSYTNFAPSQKLFAQILPSATLTPTGADYSAWVQGMGEATGAIIQNPSTTVDQAVSILKSYVTNQLGSSNVETIK